MARVQGLVWRRVDFRESSRLITLITREQGRVTVLAKGAHRPNSACLGRLDFLNTVEATLSGRPEGLQLLSRIRLVHEPRCLRQPGRYLAVAHLVELLDRAFLDGRADAELFDLLVGGLVLIERCPLTALTQVTAGLELRYLRALGQLTPLCSCASCPADQDLWYSAEGLACRAHACSKAVRMPPAALVWLRALEACAGRELPQQPPPPRQALQVLELWVRTATEQRMRFRRLALAGPAHPIAALAPQPNHQSIHK